MKSEQSNLKSLTEKYHQDLLTSKETNLLMAIKENYDYWNDGIVKDLKRRKQPVYRVLAAILQEDGFDPKFATERRVTDYFSVVRGLRVKRGVAPTVPLTDSVITRNLAVSSGKAGSGSSTGTVAPVTLTKSTSGSMGGSVPAVGMAGESDPETCAIPGVVVAPVPGDFPWQDAAKQYEYQESNRKWAAFNDRDRVLLGHVLHLAKVQDIGDDNLNVVVGKVYDKVKKDAILGVIQKAREYNLL